MARAAYVVLGSAVAGLLLGALLGLSLTLWTMIFAGLLLLTLALSIVTYNPSLRNAFGILTLVALFALLMRWLMGG